MLVWGKEGLKSLRLSAHQAAKPQRFERFLPLESATEGMFMPAIDFQEIPESHIANGKQDTFELFARDFLECIGYEILEGPDRGIDGGRDLIVAEARTGIAGKTTIKWLVSCKHKAHSGKSVSQDDEPNILERVAAKKCQGFMGVYSTLPSSSLSSRLDNLKERIETFVFDHEKIEQSLLSTTSSQELARRYFPNSFSQWKQDNPTPATIFSNQGNLYCKYCGKNLLDPPSGIIVIWHTWNKKQEESFKKEIVAIYWCCKGGCDHNLRYSYRNAFKLESVTDGWEDIPDLCIPLLFARMVMTVMNELYGKARSVGYREPAFEEMKEFILSIFPYVSRHTTNEEKNRIQGLMMIPDVFGGLGQLGE